MKRREFLAAVGGGAIGIGISGCMGLGQEGTSSNNSENGTPKGENQAKESMQQFGNDKGSEGFPPTICEEEMNKKLIAAVTRAGFDTSWDGYEIPGKYGKLNNKTNVIGIEIEGEARAYPLSVVFLHEIVNDTIGSTPVIVTYCPLCNSGMTAVRRVEGDETIFGVSGLLWKPPRIDYEVSRIENRTFSANREGDDTEIQNSGNLVMYDEKTESYWSQILASAICGSQEGEDLEIIASTFTNWGEWRQDYPDTRVLLPPPHSKTIEDRL